MVHHGGWGTQIFLFLDAADGMVIGAKIVLSGKSILSRKSQGFRDSIKRKGKKEGAAMPGKT